MFLFREIFLSKSETSENEKKVKELVNQITQKRTIRVPGQIYSNRNNNNNNKVTDRQGFLNFIYAIWNDLSAFFPMRNPLNVKCSDPNWGPVNMVQFIAKAINNFICNGQEMFMQTEALGKEG